MSSEGSVSTGSSSRIRQFGLYRTIDARTEEFLRLSRKRQIKQGCACAVISTAITVTVVITFFLVYMEYGMNTTNQQALGKAGWIGLLNDSLASSLEEKFSKSKINFDRNSIKLLPILIKALKQNNYFEKVIEDYSSPSPAYDGKLTTEFSFKKDIFLSKTWLKKPSSRLFTIEYRTSPLVVAKTPSKEPGYFTKNRKIRDYKIIMDYVKKMINDKVGLESKQIMTNKEKLTEKESEKMPRQVTSESETINSKNILSNKKDDKPKQDDIISCKCPNRLSVILDKILTSIQQLATEDKVNKPSPCSDDQKIITPESKPDTTFHLPKTKLTTTSKTITINAKATKHKPSQVQFSEFDNIFHTEETTNLPRVTSQPMHLKYFNELNPHEPNKIDKTNLFKNEDATVPPIYLSAQTTHASFSESKNMVQANDLKVLPPLWSYGDIRTTTVYDHIEPTENYYDTIVTTEPMPPMVDLNKSDKISNTITVTGKNWLSESVEQNTATSEIIQSKLMNTNSDQIYPNQNFSSENKNPGKLMQLRHQNNDQIRTDNNIRELKTINIHKLVESEEHNTVISKIMQPQLVNTNLDKIDPNQNLSSENRNPENIMDLLNIHNDQITTDNNLEELNKLNIHSFELLKPHLIPPSKRISTKKHSISSKHENEYNATDSIHKSSTKILSTENPITSTRSYVYSYVDKIISNFENNEKNTVPRFNFNYKAMTTSNTSNSSTKNNTDSVITDQHKNKQEPFYLALDNMALEDEIEKITRDDDYQEESNMNRPKSAPRMSNTVQNSTSELRGGPEKDFWEILKNNQRPFVQNSMLPIHNRPTYLEIHRNNWKHEENTDYNDPDTKHELFDLF